jgi:ribosome-associated protein YbcJ (S4-like RNA binding protein)
MVLVNGSVETRPGTQLAAGDTISMEGHTAWRVTG